MRCKNASSNGSIFCMALFPPKAMSQRSSGETRRFLSPSTRSGKVIAAAEKARLMKDDTLLAVSETIECICRRPSKEEAEAGKKLVVAEKRTHEELCASDYEGLRNLFYAKEAVRMYENPELSAKLEITAFRIGEAVIVTAPAELFVEFALDIKANSEFLFTMVSSLTNGMVGYVATRDALESGGYESRLCSSAKMSAETGYALADTAKKLLNTCNKYERNVCVTNVNVSSRAVHTNKNICSSRQ